ncbi:MAG TPA: hypothetical protein VF020_09265 [Chthoniobacterales bacterium]
MERKKKSQAKQTSSVGLASEATLYGTDRRANFCLRRHIVFYREEVRGILVSRILHERMLPEEQGMEDEREN